MDKEIKSSVFAKMAQHISNESSIVSYNNINELKMDSKNILNKIITMLGIEGKEVELEAFGNGNAASPIYGKLEGGGAVKADFWDLGHMVFVIKDDGSEVLAPDADHVIYLPSGLAGGNKRYFITTKGGVITSMNLEDTHGGVKKDVNFSTQTETEMEKTLDTTVELAEKTMNETAAVKKEEKMADPAQRLDSLEEQVNQLRVDIAQLFEEMKKESMDMAIETKDESAMVKKIQEKDEFQGKPNDGGPSKYNMSKEKKFNGAPVEEKVNLGGLVKSTKGGTVGSVLARMANSRF